MIGRAITLSVTAQEAELLRHGVAVLRRELLRQARSADADAGIRQQATTELEASAALLRKLGYDDGAIALVDGVTLHTRPHP